MSKPNIDRSDYTDAGRFYWLARNRLKFDLDDTLADLMYGKRLEPPDIDEWRQWIDRRMEDEQT